MFSTTNLKTAGVVTIVMLLASNFTAGKGQLIQGAAMFAAALGGIAIAAKV